MRDNDLSRLLCQSLNEHVQSVPAERDGYGKKVTGFVLKGYGSARVRGSLLQSASEMLTALENEKAKII